MINLSGVALDDQEINLLSRGLSFCPTPRQANNEIILDDLEGYFRRLRLKEFFLDEEEENDNAETQSQFRPSSKWMPPKGRDTALETYIKKVRTDVERQLEANKNKRCKDNLPSVEKKCPPEPPTANRHRN